MNRTKDGRFIDARVKVSPQQIEKILLQIKEEQHLSWKKFAELLDVSEFTLSQDWRNGKTTLPLSVFEKMERIFHLSLVKDLSLLPPFWGQKNGSKSKNETTITIPMIATTEFAEFYGTLLGDGCIYSTKQTICITCNSILDGWYVEKYLKNLCLKLFNYTPSIIRAKREKSIRLFIHSTKIAHFLLQLGFPAGKKKEAIIQLPHTVLTKPKLAFACLRGLIDTDGGIYPHPHSNIMLDFTSINESLLDSAQKIFELAGIHAGRTKHSLQIYGTAKLQQYFLRIGSSNPRNIMKYQTFINTGHVLKATEEENIFNKQSFPATYTGPWSSGLFPSIKEAHK